MRKQVSKKILIRYAEGDVEGAKSAQMASHIEKCPECGNSLALASMITRPSNTGDMKPGGRVLKNILLHYDKFLVSHRNDPAKQGAKLPVLRMALMGAGALIVATSVIIYAFYRHMRFEIASMKATKVTGRVLAGRNEVKQGQSLIPGVLLTTGDNSRLALIYGTIMKLNAGPHTKIYITKSRIDKKTGKIYFELAVDSGAIIAVFDKSGNLEYTLKTPHGKVSSRGSTIAMKVDHAKTRVAVKEGEVNLTSSRGRTVNSEEGNEYTITSTGVEASAVSTDEGYENSSELYENTAKDLLDNESDDVSVQ
jgi:hypothetical protein